MPSPLGHSLAGLAILGAARILRQGRGYAWALPALRRGAPPSAMLLMAALGSAAIVPDLDFIPGILVGQPDWLHRGLSHSLAAAGLFGLVSYGSAAVLRLRGAGVFGVLMAAAYTSHLVLDMFSPDPVRFNGVPLFWPLSSRHVILPAQVFLEIRRDPNAGGFLVSLWNLHNVHAVLREALVMGGLLLTGWMASRGLTGPSDPLTPATRRSLDRRLDSES